MTEADQAEWQRENLKGAIRLGGQTIKSLELVNGGAVIAVLTLYGHLAISGQSVMLDRRAMERALVCFATGVGCAVGTSILAYLSQLAAAQVAPVWLDQRGRNAAIVLGLLSLGAFIAGVWQAGVAFR
jgi:Flp pilus assembly CpaE family ATPase